MLVCRKSVSDVVVKKYMTHFVSKHLNGEAFASLCCFPNVPVYVQCYVRRSAWFGELHKGWIILIEASIEEFDCRSTFWMSLTRYYIFNALKRQDLIHKAKHIERETTRRPTRPAASCDL
jgi:hypothetical protein